MRAGPIHVAPPTGHLVAGDSAVAKGKGGLPPPTPKPKPKPVPKPKTAVQEATKALLYFLKACLTPEAMKDALTSIMECKGWQLKLQGAGVSGPFGVAFQGDV